MSRELGLPFDPIDRAARIWERRFGPSSAMAAVTSIMRAQQLLLGELDAILRPHELTFARYEALVLLSFSREGTLPLRVMGERLMVHPTSVTNITYPTSTTSETLAYSYDKAGNLKSANYGGPVLNGLADNFATTA